MKNSIELRPALWILACCMAIGGSSAAQNVKPVDSAYANSHYVERMEVFSKMPH
jgi:hypothetical protein